MHETRGVFCKTAIPWKLAKFTETGKKHPRAETGASLGQLEKNKRDAAGGRLTMGQGRWALARCSRGAAGPWPEAGPCWSSRGQRVRAPAARRTRGAAMVAGLTVARDPARRAAEHCRGGEERAAPAMGVPDPGGDGRRRQPAKGIERETMREQGDGEGATKREESREGGLGSPAAAPGRRSSAARRWGRRRGKARRW